MAGRNMNRGKATPPYEWKHGWIPLTPGAALIKAKGSARAATRLKAKHSITAASSRPDSPARNAGTKTRTVGRPADIPTPDTTVAASSRRAAIGRMSDAQLAERARTTSNGQSLRFIQDEQAKRGVTPSTRKSSPDPAIGVPLPDGYKLELRRLSDGSAGGYDLIHPDGSRSYAGQSQTEAAKRARSDVVFRDRLERQRQQRAADKQQREAAESDRTSALRERLARPLPREDKADSASRARVAQLAVAMRHNRGGRAADEPSLSADKLIEVRDSPNTSTADKAYAERDLAFLGYREAKRRLGSQEGKTPLELAALRTKIAQSDLPKHERAGAAKYLGELILERDRSVKPDKPRQPGIDSASRPDKSRAKVRDLPAGDSFKGIHSETYKGERLTVRKGREWGKLDVQINGQSVGTLYGTKNSDAVKHLDALRGNVDHAKDNPGNYTNGAGETTYGMKLGKPAAPAALPAVDPRAAALREAAAKKRAEAAGIFQRAGVDDPAANRLSGRGLAQAHRNTDSSLRRNAEATRQAEGLEHKARLADARAKEAGRTRLTREDVEGATHIVDQHGQPREVVRVNAKTVTVKTPYSWTETVPIEKIRRAIKATPEQIEAAKRKAALRVVR